MTSDQLRTWRKLHGKTQAQAARMFGLSLRTWQRYEGNRSDVPRPVAKLCRLIDRAENKEVRVLYDA